jgi:hypothetical protein
VRNKIILLKVVLILAVIAVTLVGSVGTVSAAKPTTFTVNYNQAQDQWRGVSDFGAWTPGYSYLAYATNAEFTLTGNTLHTSWSYSPVVTDLAGQSTVYTYDKVTDLWIEHEGQVSYGYAPGYGDYPVVNYFRGYLKFDGTPYADTFMKGVAYQWAYIFAPQDAVLTGKYTPKAVWDSKVGAWLVGFSIYRWDPSAPDEYTPFPDPFPEPVPASNFNPLNL